MQGMGLVGSVDILGVQRKLDFRAACWSWFLSGVSSFSVRPKSVLRVSADRWDEIG